MMQQEPTFFTGKSDIAFDKKLIIISFSYSSDKCLPLLQHEIHNFSLKRMPCTKYTEQVRYILLAFLLC